jgi:hypothetical protein
MPVRYYKCTCGVEQREITKIDTEGYIALPNGRHRFDPAAAKLAPIVHTKKCTCGEVVIETEDPKAVRSFIQFNFMAD